MQTPQHLHQVILSWTGTKFTPQPAHGAAWVALLEGINSKPEAVHCVEVMIVLLCNRQSEG